jgi:hypothetical protein
MYPHIPYYNKLNPEVTIWMIVLAIVILEFHHLRHLLVFLFMKLYEIFVQHNADGL